MGILTSPSKSYLGIDIGTQAIKLEELIKEKDSKLAEAKKAYGGLQSEFDKKDLALIDAQAANITLGSERDAARKERDEVKLDYDKILEQLKSKGANGKALAAAQVKINKWKPFVDAYPGVHKRMTAAEVFAEASS